MDSGSSDQVIIVCHSPKDVDGDLSRPDRAIS